MSKFDKRVGFNNNGEDGKNFICVGEKTRSLEILLNSTNREAQKTAGRMENFLKINKWVCLGGKYRIFLHLLYFTVHKLSNTERK